MASAEATAERVANKFLRPEASEISVKILEVEWVLHIIVCLSVDAVPVAPALWPSG